MESLRTSCEAESDIIRFFDSCDNSAEVSDAKRSSLSVLSALQEEDKMCKSVMSGREVELKRLRGELDNDVSTEETERSERLQRCCLEIGRLRTVKETVLKLRIEYNELARSCEISPVYLPDYSQRSDAFLSLFREELENSPNECVRVCVDENDNLYVTSGRDMSVSVYDRDMQFLRQFENDLLTWPYSIVTWCQKIFVTEWDSSSLVKFSSDGVLLSRARGLPNPAGLAVSKSGLVYVAMACSDPSVVGIFTQDLEFVTSFGVELFNNPCDVKIARDNSLLILDQGGRYVHVISPDGYHAVFATGCDNNMLFFTTDQFDNILLSNFAEGSIKVYSDKMELITSLDNTGRKQTLSNRSLTVRHDGVIVCVSHREPCLNFF